MKHTDKIKMAKKMLTKEEILKKTPIFQSNAWESRKEAKKLRVSNNKTK